MVNDQPTPTQEEKDDLNRTNEPADILRSAPAQQNPPLNALQAVRERLEWIAARMSNDNPEQAENSEALERLAEVEAYLAKARGGDRG